MKLFGTKRNAAHVAKKGGGKRKQDSVPAPKACEERIASEEDYAAAVEHAYETEQTEVTQRRSRPRSRGRVVRRVVVILLIVALVAGGGLYALMNWYIRPPDPPEWDQRRPDRPPPTINHDPGNSISNPTTPDEGTFTVLVAGQDNVGTHGLTDMLMLVTIDAANGSVNLVNIPRDTKVDFNQGAKVNEVFPRSNGSIERLMEEVGRVIGFMPDYYVTVNLRGFVALVDVLDGVYFNVPIRMQYSDPYDSPPLHINLEPGYQTLHGAQAMGFVRYRRTIGDLGRIANQQVFLRAVADELLQVRNVTRIPALAEVFIEHVDTNLPLHALLYLARELAEMDSENINFHTMRTEDAWIRGGSFQILILDEWLELVNTYLNPTPVAVTTEHIRVHTRINGEIVLTGEGLPMTRLPS